MKRFKIISKNLSYKKSDLALSLILLILVFTVTLLSCSFLTTTQRLIDMNKNNNINARTFIVKNDIEPSEHIFKKISMYDHIVAVFTQKSRKYPTDLQIVANNNKYSVSVTFVGANDKTIPIISTGNKINFNSNEILVPEIIKTIEGEEINGESLINNIIEIQIEELDFSESYYNPNIDPKIVAVHNKEFKVVGTYDSNKIITWENQFIASFKEVERLNKIYEGNLDQCQDKNPVFMVTADKYDNIGKVSSILRAEGYRVDLAYRFNEFFISLIMNLIFIIAITALVLSVIMLSSIQIRNVNKRANDIGLMKALGYRNKSIIKVMIFHIEIVSFIAFVLALVIACLIAHFLEPIIFKDNINMSIFNKKMILNLISAVIIPLLSAGFSLKKILKISPVVAMKEVE